MSAQPVQMPGAKIIREIRINPIVPSESVLVATARSMRPKKEETLAPHDARPHVATCPFCRGNEAMTPALIAQVPAEGVWQLRIVENLYPVLGDDRDRGSPRCGAADPPQGPARSTRGSLPHCRGRMGTWPHAARRVRRQGFLFLGRTSRRGHEHDSLGTIGLIRISRMIFAPGIWTGCALIHILQDPRESLLFSSARCPVRYRIRMARAVKR